MTLTKCQKCNNISVHIIEDEPSCLTCGWSGYKGMDQETARKEVERESRRQKYLRRNRGIIK
jgi:hypothetical protein